MPELTDQVPVLYQDLELFAMALANAESQAAALDALMSVRNLKMEKSKLRGQLARASQRANALIASINEAPGE